MKHKWKRYCQVVPTIFKSYISAERKQKKMIMKKVLYRNKVCHEKFQ